MKNFTLIILQAAVINTNSKSAYRQILLLSHMPSGEQYLHRRERSYGAYSRSFDISNIDPEHIDAEYKNGVLILNLPKKQEVVPSTRRLEIK